MSPYDLLFPLIVAALVRVLEGRDTSEGPGDASLAAVADWPH